MRLSSKSVGRAFAFALAAAIPAQPASAQGLLDAIFGGFDRSMRRDLPPRANAYSDPFGMPDPRGERRSSAGQRAGPSSGYCVRTCDGRFFPVRSQGGMSATDLCRAFCPAATTKVFAGSKIDHAAAADDTRYADLPNAFLYRERAVDNCTCNGRTRFGLVPLDAATDPTLRPGDIVATNDGLVTVTGSRKSRSAEKSAEFTPIEQSGGSAEWRRRLMEIKVTPAPPRADPPAVAAEDKPERADNRRAQR